MVVKLGINEWPMPGRLVRRKTYLKEYDALVHKDGVPFVPVAFTRDLVFGGAIVLAVMACAAYFGPFGPKGFPDPTIVDTLPRPDYFFLWLFAVASLLPPHLETPALLVGPVIGIGLLLALPFIAGEGEKSWRRRPMAVLTIVLVAVSLGTLTRLGTTAPWSPVMNAWSSAPVPARTARKAAPRSSGRARSSCRPSSAATVMSSATKAAGAGPLSTTSRCASPATSSSARSCRGVATCPPTATA